MNTPARRYFIEFGGAMAAYTVLLMVSVTVLNTVDSGAWRYAVAVLPVAPLGFALRAFIRHLRRLDELQRRTQLEALAVGFGATIMITITYGFLENAGLPRLSLIWMTPLMIFLWGIGSAIAGRHYR
jgi:hypothetical protein